MQDIPVVKIERANYENIEVSCPFCGSECTFNRASDLCTFETILGLNVRCLNRECARPFRITNDLAIERHEMLVYDCYELLKRKQYMYCILNLTVAYETFFSLFLRVELLYKPCAADPSLPIDKLNMLLIELGERTERHTFQPMRALFLRHIVEQITVPNLCLAEDLIERRLDQPKDVSNSEIEALDNADDMLIDLLKDLNRTKIHELRNRVAHKKAYRPKRMEAEGCLEEARSILFPLTYRLNLRDDLNWYMLDSSAMRP